MSYNFNYKNWIEFHKTWCFGFMFNYGNYKNEKPTIQITVTQIISFIIFIIGIWYSQFFMLLIPFLLFGYGTLFISLSYNTGLYQAEYASYGISYINHTIAIYYGLDKHNNIKVKYIKMPWALIYIKTSILLKDELSWVDENQIGTDDKDKIYSNNYPFTYTLKSGEMQNVTVTISIKKIERRYLIFKWTKLFAVENKVMHYYFSEFAGQHNCSYVKGTTGGNIEMLENETVLECLDRMKTEKIFN
jgi:hypothetical protein